MSSVAHLENGSFRPTPEFMAHHAVLPPAVDRNVRRDAYRVRTRLEMLVDFDLSGESVGGEINPDEYEAGLRWRRDCETAEAGAIKSMLDQTGVRGSGKAAGPSVHRLNAIERARRAMDAIGREASLFLMASVVNDLSWQSVAATVQAAGFKCSEKTAKVRVCDALRGLCRYYDVLDGVGRSRKRAERLRVAYGDFDVDCD
jgi:hypothetical protein